MFGELQEEISFLRGYTHLAFKVAIIAAFIKDRNLLSKWIENIRK